MPTLRPDLPTAPGWTKIPNRLLDRLLPDLGDTELRVLLVLLRATTGFQKEGRTISLSSATLTSRTGRKDEAVARALDALRRRGLLHIPRADPHADPRRPGARRPDARGGQDKERR